MASLFTCAAALASAAADAFIAGCCGDIAPRIISWLIDTFMRFRSNRGQMNSSQSSGGQMNSGEPNREKMLIARVLEIKHSDDGKYWMWVLQRESRFTEVAEALQVWVLRVKARINLDELSPETNYAAHLIFKTRPHSRGLDTFQSASVYADGCQWMKNVCVTPRVARPNNKCNVYPVKRSDGWMELELGQFYCDGGTGEVVVSFEEGNVKNKKTGLIVAGIELRPI